MFGITTLGLIGLISSGVIFVAILTTIPGLYGVLAAISKSIILFATSSGLLGVGSGWSTGDMYKSIEKKVKNRYYFRGIFSSANSIPHSE